MSGMADVEIRHGKSVLNSDERAARPISHVRSVLAPQKSMLHRKKTASTQPVS